MQAAPLHQPPLGFGAINPLPHALGNPPVHIDDRCLRNRPPCQPGLDPERPLLGLGVVKYPRPQ